MLLSLTLCILILIPLIGSAWLLAQSAAKRFQDAPDRDPYLDRLLGEIAKAAPERDCSGGMELGRNPSAAHTQTDVRTRHSGSVTR